MSDIMMTNRIMQIHLSSWRYFAALTLPPLALIYNISFSAHAGVMIGFFLLTHYYCWRLWLDERLFQLIDNENDLTEFDNGMAHLWANRKGINRSLVERWCGATIIFYKTIFSLVALWLVSLYILLFQTFG